MIDVVLNHVGYTNDELFDEGFAHFVPFNKREFYNYENCLNGKETITQKDYVYTKQSNTDSWVTNCKLEGLPDLN